MDLDSIKLKVEMMDKVNQIQILKILKDNNITITENKNGIFVNLSGLDDNVINKINDYINHYETQEIDFNKQENIKDQFKETLIDSSQ